MDKKSFKKFRLVAADEEDQDRRKFKDIKEYDPAIWNRVRTDKEIESVLDNQSLPPDIKLRLINSLIIMDKEKLKKNFEKAQAEGMLQIQPQIPAQVPGLIIQQPDLAGHAAHQGAAPANLQPIPPQTTERELVDVSLGFPAYLKLRTEKLLAALKTNYPGLITTNDRFELIVDKNIIPNSNVVDILGFMVNPGKRKLPPNGYAAFLSALAAVNINPSIVPSQKIRKFLGKSSREKERKRDEDVSFDESSFFDPQGGTGKRKKKKAIGYIFAKKKNLMRYKKPSYFKSLNLY